ncbi:glycosyltransferase family 4 protein [Rufibacter glacialis]|uniref:Glycosyltransferase family 4 protein n=1 Tax=Rufibacter glacialis TaxID=1259555 RepID=A0A5M8Q8G4_9BACT|nr:glycosyltransferase family 4 protein [Rufibacter glacialis]KAA6431156.1 glycosyltransferase family 4 protein [Rufibacter glacialis]GGK84552.1 glycosyltransferase WbuB [Rufibacter glacialis]
MHIALFHQYHHNPDCPATCRHYTFMAELVKRHKITLITSNAWESKRLTQLYDWVPPGVELISIKAPYSNSMGVVQRLRAFGSFATHALVKGLKMPKPDVIWGVSTPLTTAWAAAQVAKIRRVPWVFEVQDLWPSFPIQMGAVPSAFAQRQLYSLEQSLYRQAAHIIPLSTDMEQYILEKGIAPQKITTLENGTEIPTASMPLRQQEALREKLGLQGKQVVLYAGTYGRANDMPMLLKAAALLQDQEQICFVFTGQGFEAPLLEEAAKRQKNIRLLPPLPRPDVLALFSLASVSVVSFIDLPVLKANSPGKLFDSLAMGTPVVVTNAGWTKNLVETHGCGWYVPAGDASALAHSLKKTLGNEPELAGMRERAAQEARSKFDRLQMVPVLEEIFEKVAQKNA